MAKEALTTFTFDAPTTISQVELLGSWDNFTHAYPMRTDQRRGNGHWTGCFRFADVVFDGDQFAAPRCGGLAQGGMYWYFFRLDNAVEAYDDLRENTIECPLLPGQPVNVIEIPIDLDDAVDCVLPSEVGMLERMRRAVRGAYEHTLDPDARYRPLSRPSSFSRPHRKQSMEQRRSEMQMTPLPISLADLAVSPVRPDTSQAFDGTTGRISPQSYGIDLDEQPQHYKTHPEAVFEDVQRRKKGSSISTEQSYAATIDTSTAATTPSWRGPLRSHLKSISGSSQRSREDNIEKAQWKNPSVSLMQSLRRYYFVS